MCLAPSNRRAFAGLYLAMPLIAIGPLVAVAQNGNVRTMPKGYPTATSPNGYRDANAPPPKRESLFGDQGLHWKMPFTRSKTAAKSQVAPQQSTAGRSIPRTALQDPRSGQPSRTNMSARAPMAQPQVAPNRYQPQAVAKPTMQTARAPQQAAQRSTAPLPPRASQLLEPPRPMPNAARTAPVSAARSAQVAPKTSPATPAMQMLAQAHEWSTSAGTESDLTRIIDTCRRAAAEQSTPEISRYANELASWALNRRGQLKAEADCEQEALSDFNAAIQADARRWRAVHNRGVLFAGNGEFEKAFDDFTRTIDLNPKFAKAYSNRAALFVVAGNVQSAIQDYTRAIELDPELTVAHRGLGRACHLDSQFDTAIRHYDEAVRLAPNDAYAIASRADVLTDLGRYAEAAAEYDRAIKTDPNSSHAQSGSAWLLATCPDEAVRNPKLALERAQGALEMTNGEDAASLDTLAAAQANNGDFAAATQSVEKAIQLATPGEKDSYLARLSLYQQEKPYRLEADGIIVQTSHKSQ